MNEYKSINEAKSPKKSGSKWQTRGKDSKMNTEPRDYKAKGGSSTAKPYKMK